VRQLQRAVDDNRVWALLLMASWLQQGRNGLAGLPEAKEKAAALLERAARTGDPQVHVYGATACACVCVCVCVCVCQ
jgi:hypothetical protein